MAKSKLSILRERVANVNGKMYGLEQLLYDYKYRNEKLEKKIDALQSENSDLRDNILALRTEVAIRSPLPVSVEH